MSVCIIDYGSGNLRSAAKAFEYAAAESGLDTRVAVTGDAGALDNATHIVLPGVGAFGDCLRGLKSVPGMTDALHRNVISGGKPFLGICVGMQLLAETGLEHGVYQGLGWIAGEVRPVAPSDPSLKIPHMGWNDLSFEPGRHPLLEGIAPGGDAYFVHSYYLAPAHNGDILAEVDYGGAMAAIVGRGNIAGTQFHPEKSQAVGLKLIGNFLAWRP